MKLREYSPYVFGVAGGVFGIAWVTFHFSIWISVVLFIGVLLLWYIIIWLFDKTISKK